VAAGGIVWSLAATGSHPRGDRERAGDKKPSGPWLASGPLMITTSTKQIIWISFEGVKEELYFFEN
jgi:hypothetical protein